MSLSEDAGVSWSAPFASFPDTLRAMDVAIHPQQPDLVYVATLSGISVSTDGGRHWRWSLRGPRLEWPYAYQVRQVQLDPFDPGVVYAATITPGLIYRSSDGGEHWAARQGTASSM